MANGLSSLSETLTDSTLQMVRNIPHLALIPLVILWFGIEEEAKLFLVALGVFFPVYVNTLHDCISALVARHPALEAVTGDPLPDEVACVDPRPACASCSLNNRRARTYSRLRTDAAESPAREERLELRLVGCCLKPCLGEPCDPRSTGPIPRDGQYASSAARR